MPTIRDRIKELRRVPARQLLANPLNWRTHPQEQREILRGVLSEVGFADAVIARETEDGSLELIDGHLRAELNPDVEVPVLVLDVTEDEARKLLATLDPLAAKAETDPEKLDELLRSIDTESEALASMLAELAVANGLSSSESELRPIEVKPPPAMAWVLIGIPTVRFGEIAATIEQLAEVEGITIETTANDG